MVSKTAVLIGCAGAATAIYYVRKLVQQTDNQDGEKPSSHVFEYLMMVPRGSLGMICGRDGRTATSIYHEIGASMRGYSHHHHAIKKIKASVKTVHWESHTEDQDVFDKANSVDEDFVHVRAPTKEKLNLAFLRIKGILVEWQTQRTVERILIPTEAVGYVIGRNGRYIKNISYECNVRTIIVDFEENHQIMEISGSEDGIAAAVERIQGAVARYFRKNGNAQLNDTTSFGSRGLYDNAIDEVSDMKHIKELLEAEEEFW